MGMEMGMDDLELQDEDPDRRPTTLLGRIRRFFDRSNSESRWHDWWDHHPPGAWYAGDGSGWGGGWDGGGGCDGGGCGSC